MRYPLVLFNFYPLNEIALKQKEGQSPSFENQPPNNPKIRFIQHQFVFVLRLAYKCALRLISFQHWCRIGL
jgi:hypothetical protein